jgi:hypothetical protein
MMPPGLEGAVAIRVAQAREAGAYRRVGPDPLGGAGVGPDQPRAWRTVADLLKTFGITSLLGVSAIFAV